MQENPYVEVEEEDRPLTFADAIKYAVDAGAVVPGDSEEDSSFHFLFPGHLNPKYYTWDELAAELRSFNNPTSGE